LNAYVPDRMVLGCQLARKPIALSTVKVLIAIGPVYAVDASVGVLPSVV
jgi:hypothetical protein